MKFTDLFIRRPVLALVVNLVIIIAGLAGDPLAQRPPVSPQRELRRSRSPPSTSAPAPTWCAASSPRRSSAPSPPPTASTTSSRRAAQGLSTISARLKLNYDPTKALAEISSKVDQVRSDLPPEAEVPVINIESADSQFAVGLPELHLRHPRAEPDHRLPHPHRAAAPLRPRGRAARRHPRRPHLRHAHLAQARPHGRAQRQPGAGPRRRWPPTTILAAVGQTKGSLVQVNLTANTDLRSVEEFKQPRHPRAGRRPGAAGGHRRRRARRRGLRHGGAASRARPPCSWASGRCPTPTRSTSSSASAPRWTLIQKELPTGMQARHRLRRHRVHQERHPARCSRR